MDKKPPLISTNNFVILFFALAVFSLTRQFPVKAFSSLILVFLVLAIGMALPKIWENFNQSKQEIKIITTIYFILFTTIFLYSVMVRDNDLGNAVRTYAVCIFLAVTYFFIKDKRIVKVFVFVVLLHSLVLIGLQVYMMIKGSPGFDWTVRRYFLNNGFGDIYSRNRLIYRIIIKGNELLPVAFMICDMMYKKGLKRLLKYIMLIATVIAGNLAYFIAIALYMFLKMITNKNGRKLLLGLIYAGMALFLILNKPILNYVTKTIELKNESSMPIRYEQIDAIIEDFDSIKDLFFGRGMGNTITADKPHRDYVEERYFELQIVYFFNQLGIIAFSYLIFYNLYLPIKILNKDALIIYGCYLLYAVTNPYILNLTHVIVIMAMISFKEAILDKDGELETSIKAIQ